MNSLQLRKAILYSTIAHGIAVVLIHYLSGVSPLKTRTQVVWLEMPRGISSIASFQIKESKDLPKTTIAEQKRVMETPQQKKKSKPLTYKAKKSEVQEKPMSAEEKKIQEALSKIEKDIKQQEFEAAQVKNPGEGFQFGTGLEPVAIPPNDPEYLAYQATVQAKIMREWITPYSEPTAQLIIFINQNGAIVSTEWERKSENPSFDASCLRAIQRASPLPIPPDRIKWEAFREGFLIDFDQRLKQE